MYCVTHSLLEAPRYEMKSIVTFLFLSFPTLLFKKHILIITKFSFVSVVLEHCFIDFYFSLLECDTFSCWVAEYNSMMHSISQQNTKYAYATVFGFFLEFLHGSEKDTLSPLMKLRSQLLFSKVTKINKFWKVLNQQQNNLISIDYGNWNRKWFYTCLWIVCLHFFQNGWLQCHKN